MKKFLITAIAATALLSAPALGADMPVKAPVYRAAPLFDWSGFYLGANAGYGWGTSDSSINPGILLRGDTDPAGGIYGGHLGAQKQFSNNWVLGLQLTLLGASMKDTVVPTAAGFGPIPGVTKQHKIHAIGLAEVKLGYATQSGWGPMLPYLIWGAACVRSDSTISVSGLGSLTSHKTDQCGWTIGVGVDWALSMPGWIFGLKYNYADLGTKDHAFPVFGGIGISIPEDQQLNLVQAELSYKF